MRTRARPFKDQRRSILAAVLSCAAILIGYAYLVLPAPSGDCIGRCSPAPWVQTVYDTAACATFIISLYFVTLYVIGLWVTRRGARLPRGPAPFFVVVTPAHNEEVVIEATVKRVLALKWDRYVALIMNDGSSDGTSEVAREAAGGDPRLIVVDRPAEIAGQGKGEVLNHAYRVVDEMIASGDPRLQGAGPADVVFAVIDADGWLRPDALEEVAPYYADPKVAGVQVPVRMYNARESFLACMQDIEFIGFSLLIQGGRDLVGSVGLGGNGQFIRHAALRELHPAPWTKSLTEDLDIGLTLTKRGWRNRLCPHTCVAQQGLNRTRPLIRQRTRWVQGHYSCWNHLPSLWRARGVPFATRVDLSLHLFLAVNVLIVATQALLGIAGYVGLYPINKSVLSSVTADGETYRVATFVMACGPLSMLSVAYQRAAIAFQGSGRYRLPFWSLPGVILVFVGYTYYWGVPCSVRAFTRMVLRRDTWAKTPRHQIAEEPADA